LLKRAPHHHCSPQGLRVCVCVCVSVSSCTFLCTCVFVSVPIRMHLHRFKPGLCISTTSDSKRNKHTLTHTATHNGAKQVHCLTSLSKPYLLRFATPVTASACAILRQNRCTVCQAVQTLPAAVATPVTASACAKLRQNRCTVCQAVQTLPAAVASPVTASACAMLGSLLRIDIEPGPSKACSPFSASDHIPSFMSFMR